MVRLSCIVSTYIYYFQVGKTISTKSVGGSKRCDITHNYKFEEGSIMERTALGVDQVDTATDMAFDVQFNQQAVIGEDFDVTVTVRIIIVIFFLLLSGIKHSIGKEYSQGVSSCECASNNQCSSIYWRNWRSHKERTEET